MCGRIDTELYMRITTNDSVISLYPDLSPCDLEYMIISPRYPRDYYGAYYAPFSKYGYLFSSRKVS